MQLADLKWNEVAALSRDTPVVFPVAALEQHGRHMPVFTDSMLTNELVRRTEEQLLKLKNFGRTSVKEVEKKLQALELSFGMDVAAATKDS